MKVSEMKDEYDFSEAEQGRFYRPIEEHQSERFAFGYILYWLARSNRL
uniref:Uncharacterized protein n=1 Tax=Candidatus Kentrum sp. SD TaxID=2126332 RepID=A0A451BQU2_9GAMM|nr:MAG: hypothetical protein BECKSD772D_GA0070982_11437 [Candidatus Kentron sp. SD]